MAGNVWSGAIAVEIDRIDDEPARSMRAEKLADLAAEYAECLEDLPPIRVIAGPDDKHWCCDGSTRLDAHRIKGKEFVLCLIKRGTFEDAWREAARANATHGARVTNADKRMMVERALKRFPHLSNAAIAELCGVSHTTVNRTNLNNVQVARPEKRVGRDGKARSAPQPRPRKEEPKPEPVEDDAEDEYEPDAEKDAPRREPPPSPETNGSHAAEWEVPNELEDFDPRDAFKACEAAIRSHYAAWPDDSRRMFLYYLHMLCEDMIREKGDGMYILELDFGAREEVRP